MDIVKKSKAYPISFTSAIQGCNLIYDRNYVEVSKQ